MKALIKLLAMISATFLMLFANVDITSTPAPSRMSPNNRMGSVTPSGFGSQTSLQRVKGRIIQEHGISPVSFEANEGQADQQVKYFSRSSNYQLFLTSDEAVLKLITLLPKETPIAGELISGERDITVRQAVLKMKLIRANAKPNIVGLEKLPYKSNYLIGNDPRKWRVDVSNYSRVKYESVYPGIDLLYYGNENQLEYDFTVAPGADPAIIRLAFEGAARIEIDENADLVLQTGAGEVRFHKPIIYQEEDGARKEITGCYRLDDEQKVGFQVADYDKSKPLIIDPVLKYSTYLGGGNSDVGTGIAVDSAENVYVTGFTLSTNFPVKNAMQPTIASGSWFDAFVSKYDTAGRLVYSTYLGGATDDKGLSIAVDSSGRPYITGNTISNNFPTLNPFATTGGGFVVRLNSAGNALEYGSYINVSESKCIVVDSSGSAYLAGRIDTDAFAAKVRADGQALSYFKQFGGSSIENANGIAVDLFGSAYVTGSTFSSDFPVQNPIQPNYGGFGDAFISKLSSDGSTFIYSTFIGGGFVDEGSAIALDGSSRPYITGYTRSVNFPTFNPNPPPFPLVQDTCASCPNLPDVFVTNLKPGGVEGFGLRFSTYLGGSGSDQGLGITVDGNGKVYVTGLTNSTDFPRERPLQLVKSGGVDSFVAQFAIGGWPLNYSTFIGGDGDDWGQAITVHPSSENVYVTGFTLSNNFPLLNPEQPVYGGNGNRDAFVAKIASVRAAESNAVIDFSMISNPISNPIGVWRYGRTASRGATFNLYTTGTRNIQPGLDSWYIGNPIPNVTRNNKGATTDIGNVTYPVDMLQLHPGPGGEYSVVRWVAPSTGNYKINSRFQGLNRNGTTTDVHVLRNSNAASPLFSGNINGYGSATTLTFLNNLAVNAGDTIDFIVGLGSNSNNTDDNTGLAVEISENLSSVETPVGSNVAVRPTDTTTFNSPATLTFSNVNTVGSTSLTTSSSGPPPPSGLSLGNPVVYYELTTTAIFTGLITVTIDYSGINFINPANVRLYHYEGGAWVNRTISFNTLTHTVTGSVSSLSPFALFETLSPSAVELVSFTALVDNSGSTFLRWQTGFEVDNLGFNIYREQAGKRTRITSQLVAGSALLAGAAFTAGQSYVWADTLPDSKQLAHYWLEDIDLSGQATLHGPFIARAVDKLPSQAHALLLSKLISRAPQPEQREVWDSQSKIDRQGSVKALPTDSLLNQWEIASRACVRLAIRKPGWYIIAQPDLVAAGLDPSGDPRFLQLFSEGQELPIIVNGGASGRLDPTDSIEFYATGQDTTYTDTRMFYLDSGSQPGRRINKLPANEARPSEVLSFLSSIELKPRSIYFAALQNGDADNFFGPIITSESVLQHLWVNNLEEESTAEVRLDVALQGVTDLNGAAPDHNVKVLLNGVEVGEVSFDGHERPISTLVFSNRLLREGDNLISLVAEGGEMDISLLDYIRLTYPHTFRADSDILRFSATAGEALTVTGFSHPVIRVVDITDADNVRELTPSVQPQGSEFAMTITAEGEGERRLMAFTNKKMNRPASVSANQPSAWNRASNGANFVILTHRSFANEMEPLKILRQSQGLSVSVIDLEDLYDEFSYGAPSPQAVKDFLARASSVWKKRPGWVMLVGDASFDPRNYLGLGENEYTPTKLVDTSLLETASDDWFVDFNSDGLPELSIGRLPVRTSREAEVIVAKIVAYEQRGRSEGALMVADRNDGYNFEAASASVRGQMPDGLDVQEVFRSRTDDATAKQQIILRINRGPKIVNYIGHGSVGLWRGNLLTSADAASLTNSEGASLFVMMTCLNGFFHDLAGDSLAESLMKCERGGAVAVWASSALTSPDGQTMINRRIYEELFVSSATIGEAAMRAKASVSDADIRRTWILFGDPTMRLR